MGFAGTAVCREISRRETAKISKSHTKNMESTPCAIHFGRFERKKFGFRPEDGSLSPLNFCRRYRSDNRGLDSRPAPGYRVNSIGSDSANSDNIWNFFQNIVSNRFPDVRADNASDHRALRLSASVPLRILRERQNARTARQ